MDRESGRPRILPGRDRISSQSRSGRWRRWLHKSRKQLRFRIAVLYYVLRSGKIPLRTKLLGGLTLGYLVSPIDLIPDFIPILGQLDDAIILPLLVALTLRSVPKPLVRDCARKALRQPVSLSKNWRAGAVVVALWLLILILLCSWLVKGVQK